MTSSWVDNLKLRHLRVVLAIDELGGVTAAAAHLFVTQAAVSKTIAELEAQIGLPLYERSGRGIVPTDVGQQTIRVARRVMRELRSLAEEIELVTEGKSGLLTIGTQAVSIQEFLPHILATMKARAPAVTTRFVEGTLPDILRDLRSGRIDLAFGRMVPRLLSSDFDGVPLPSPPYVVVASSLHPFAKSDDALADPIEGWKLALAQDWVLPLPDTPVRTYFVGFLAGRGHSLPVNLIEITSPNMLAVFLKAMPRLAIAPLNVARAWVEDGSVEILRLELAIEMEPIGLMWSKVSPLKPPAAMFRAVALAHMASFPKNEPTG